MNFHVTLSAASPSASVWSGPVIAAIIGAVTAVLGILLRDWLIERRKERRAQLRGEQEVYERYLAPLCDACEKIVWRSREIFVLERHAFLKTTTLPLGFNGYKRTSTLYRIASLIGWIRGMDIELSSLPRRNPASTPAIAAQIKVFREALADGPSVEQDRLRRLSELWGLDLSSLSPADRARLGMRVEVKAHALAGIEAAASLSAVADLSAAKQRKLCAELATYLASELNASTPDPRLITASVADAVDSLVFREALLYRDWQDALGDEMIERDPNSVRRFRIIGFAKFCGELAEPKTPWMTVLAASIDDIDFEHPNPKDFRADQLHQLTRAAAGILVAAKALKDSPVSQGAFDTASDLLKHLPANAKN